MATDDFNPDNRFLCVGASPRKGGNSDIILNSLARAFQAGGIPCDTVRLRELDLSPCIGCEGCRNDHICRGCTDQMQELYPKIIRARGMILVSPTHHYNITAWMKAFIDRMYCFYTFGNEVPRSWSSCLAGQGRIAAVAAVCEQEDRTDMGFTIDAMEMPLKALGYEIVRTLAVFKIFKRAGIAANPREMDKIAVLADHMIRAMKTSA